MMKNLKKKTKSLLAFLLSGLLGFSLWQPLSAVAAEPNTPKEEVVYINLNSDGSVQEINVVNIFELDEAGRIIDYGEYQSLRNMTTTDSLGYADNIVTIDTGAGRLYYEGKLDSNVMPWIIDIHYYMDGKEYTGEEIAGMSGGLKITVSITENTSCKGSFFENYTLQASLTLDTDACRNISAPGAAIANVGSNKQMTYTILPGKGAEIEMTADVTDFEISGIAVNGIPLNLDMQIDDMELTGQITELAEAIKQLDDGAGKLQNGAVSLNEGIQSLEDGVGRIQYALNALNTQSGLLTGGSAEFNNALIQLQAAMSGVPSTPETAPLFAIVDALVLEYEKIDNGIVAYTGSVAQITRGYSQVSEGTAELLAGSMLLCDGTNEFKEGTAQMRSETEGMDTQITDKMDEMLGSITGGDIEIVSFTSEQNTDIVSVQFVIQAEGISVEEITKPMEEEIENLNLWQKFLRLFGLY